MISALAGRSSGSCCPPSSHAAQRVSPPRRAARSWCAGQARSVLVDRREAALGEAGRDTGWRPGCCAACRISPRAQRSTGLDLQAGRARIAVRPAGPSARSDPSRSGWSADRRLRTHSCTRPQDARGEVRRTPHRAGLGCLDGKARSLIDTLSPGHAPFPPGRRRRSVRPRRNQLPAASSPRPALADFSPSAFAAPRRFDGAPATSARRRARLNPWSAPRTPATLPSRQHAPPPIHSPLAGDARPPDPLGDARAPSAGD